MIVERRLCPVHKENTPSFVVYQSGWGHCYGCGAHIQVGTSANLTEKPKENIGDSLEYIKSLPLVPRRGLEFHTNQTGYYILWPNAKFYKKRMFEGSKYLSPVGIRKPLFIAAKNPTSSSLIIVEGEINAMSLAKAMPNINIVSPGAASDFYSVNSDRFYLPHYLNYDNIHIIVDKDKAGIVAGIELKTRLLIHKSNIKISLWENDANDLLQKEGPEGLKKYYLDMSSRVS